jgi:cell division ATPase MinD
MTIIGLVSAKGGVGKTTVAANLSALLAKQGNSVLAVDGNITTPTLGFHFGISPKDNTLTEVLKNESSIEDSVYKHESGVHLIPASFLPSCYYPDPECLKEKISSISNKYDFVIIDGAAGIGREVIASMEASDKLMVVTNTEFTSAISACKIIKIAEMLNIPVMGLVVNKALDSKHQMSSHELEELCDHRVLGSIPFDKRIPESLHHQVPIVIHRSHSKSAQSFRKLAAWLSGNDFEDETIAERLKRILSLW